MYASIISPKDGTVMDCDSELNSSVPTDTPRQGASKKIASQQLKATSFPG